MSEACEHGHHIHIHTREDAMLLGKSFACEALSYDDSGTALAADPLRAESLRSIAQFIDGTDASRIEKCVLYGLIGELLAAYQGNALLNMTSDSRHRLTEAYQFTHSSLIEILAATNPGDPRDCPRD